MHFLDIVFPLQYPMYRSGVTEGGRGWLLSLLFRTKPLYHAALALSSYHRGSVLLAENYLGCHALARTEKESHLAICLADFRQSIKKVGRWVEESCPENVIGIMACVVQLVFFEVRIQHLFCISIFILTVYLAFRWSWRCMENTSSSSNRYLPPMLQEPIDSTLSSPRIIRKYLGARFYTSRPNEIFHRDVANLQILDWGGSMVRYHLIYHIRNLASPPFNPSQCFLS